MTRVRHLALALAASVGAGCTSGTDLEARPSTPPPTQEVVLPGCEEHLPGRPEGFRSVGMREIRERDHRGVHVRYRGPDRTSIHYLVGISGEIGEGLPFRRTVSLPGGTSARFLGAAGRWVAVWDLPAPCDQAAALGRGMPPVRFLRLVTGAVSQA